jgi:hypothetical protein
MTCDICRCECDRAANLCQSCRETIARLAKICSANPEMCSLRVCEPPAVVSKGDGIGAAGAKS